MPGGSPRLPPPDGAGVPHGSLPGGSSGIGPPWRPLPPRRRERAPQPRRLLLASGLVAVRAVGHAYGVEPLMNRHRQVEELITLAGTSWLAEANGREALQTRS